MTLTDKFHQLFSTIEEDEKGAEKIAALITGAPDSPERTGLLALLYYEGIGVPADYDKAFELAEKAAFEGHDPLGYYILGYMCDHADTPDQAHGGPRQKYDHYDAERFYELCAQKESSWRDDAVLWLGDHYMNMARGGDPEVGADYYMMIADHNEEAAAALSDYFWDLGMPEAADNDTALAESLFKWTSKAASFDPGEYAYRLGWLYADGIGCEPSPDKAMEQFEKAYDHGDWRGAQAIADMLEERLDNSTGSGEANVSGKGHTPLSAEDRSNISHKIELWRRREKEAYEQSLLDDPDEADSSIEED